MSEGVLVVLIICAVARRPVGGVDPVSTYLCLRLHTPELKAVGINRFFNLGARKLVGRFILITDHADGMPGTELLRQLASCDVPGESAQSPVHL